MTARVRAQPLCLHRMTRVILTRRAMRPHQIRRIRDWPVGNQDDQPQLVILGERIGQSLPGLRTHHVLVFKVDIVFGVGDRVQDNSLGALLPARGKAISQARVNAGRWEGVPYLHPLVVPGVNGGRERRRVVPKQTLLVDRGGRQVKSIGMVIPSVDKDPE